MPKIKRIEKIKKHKTSEEELKEDIVRGIRDHFEIFPLIKKKNKKQKQ